jgi:hypothetical protein
MIKTLEELRWEKEKRAVDAIELRIPDRVPVIAGMGYFPAKYTGITCEAAWYDYDKWLAACKKTLQDFQPDFTSPQPFFPGSAYEHLEPRIVRLPGHGVSPYHSHQSIEEEYLKADEYSAFINDPSDFMLRTYLPRVCGTLGGLEKLPKLSNFAGMFMSAGILGEALATPEVAAAIEALVKSGQEMLKWRAKMTEFNQEVENMGFSPFVQGVALAPFDVISHSFRGMKGTITDMYRQPEKLLEACQKILEITLEKPLPPSNKYGNIRIGMPLTRGSDDFMSLKQFETFYWPTLKKLMLGLIEKGAILCPFYEGNFITRLEHFRELPKGKVLAHLDTTDIFKAKEIFRGHTCIQGNVPASLLQVGTVKEVKNYCRKLIDIVGEGGGFILSPRGSTDEINPENLRAMIEFTKEYGVYTGNKVDS